MKILIITLSDRAFRKKYRDLSGPKIEEILKKEIKGLRVSRVLIPDRKKALLKALRDGLAFDVVLTSGGTGLSPNDITPETTRNFCDREVPGISEILRIESYKETPHAMLSRGFAGIKKRTLIVNFPGSVKAAECCTRLLILILHHALAMMRGGKH